MISSFLKVTEPSENSQPKRRGNEGGEDEIEEEEEEEEEEGEITGCWRRKCCMKGREGGEGSAVMEE